MKPSDTQSWALLVAPGFEITADKIWAKYISCKFRSRLSHFFIHIIILVRHFRQRENMRKSSRKFQSLWRTMICLMTRWYSDKTFSHPLNLRGLKNLAIRRWARESWRSWTGIIKGFQCDWLSNQQIPRLSVAELKQLVARPDVVEMHDVTARDPR